MATTLTYPKEFARNPHYRTPPLAHEVPIATVQNRAYQLTDGSMAAVYRVRGTDYELAGDRELSTFCENLRLIINNVPANVQVKHLFRISHTVRDVLEEHEREMTGSNVFARYLAWDQWRRFHREAERGALLADENLLVVTYNPRIEWWKGDRKLDGIRQAVMAKTAKNTVLQRSRDRFTLAVNKFEDLIGPIENQMRLAGLEPARLDDRALYELAWEVLNPSEALRRPCPNIQRPSAQDPYAGLFADGDLRKVAAKHPDLAVVAPITEREQLCVSDQVVGDTWVRVGDTYYGAVVLKMLPTSHYPTLSLKLAAIPFECTIAIDLIMMHKQKELEKMWTRVRSANSKAQLALFGGTPDPAKREAAAEQERAYLELAKGSENPLRFRMVVVVGAKSVDQLDKRSGAVISLLQGLEGIQGQRVMYEVEDAIKTTWPFGLVNNLYTVKVHTSLAANLMPLFSRWGGSERAVTICTDPMRRLVRHDPMPGNLPSKNKIICGSTGTGKSFLAQQIDIHPLAAKDNTEILMVESGGSFRLTTACFGGQYIRVGPRADCHVNPFDLPVGFAELSQADQEGELSYKISFIKNLILAMVRIFDPGEQQLAENVIGKVVMRAYREKQIPRFRDVYRLLGTYRNERDAKAEELAGRLRTLLTNYVETEEGEAGPFSRYFDTFTNFNAENPILAFDLVDVKSDKSLLVPYTLVLICGLIYNRLMRRDGIERMVVIDEAWALIKAESNGQSSPAGEAIELFWRESRKLGGACTFITQAYADTQSDAIGRAVVNNSRIQYFLKHERGGINDVAFKSAGFSAQKTQKVYELETDPGRYSQVMVNEGGAWGVLQIPTVPMKYWVATTHPDDLRILTRYFETYGKKCGLDDRTVVAVLAEDYPEGAKGRQNPKGEMPLQDALQFAEQWQSHYRRFGDLVQRGERIPHSFR